MNNIISMRKQKIRFVRWLIIVDPKFTTCNEVAEGGPMFEGSSDWSGAIQTGSFDRVLILQNRIIEDAMQRGFLPT